MLILGQVGGISKGVVLKVFALAFVKRAQLIANFLKGRRECNIEHADIQNVFGIKLQLLADCIVLDMIPEVHEVVAGVRIGLVRIRRHLLVGLRALMNRSGTDQ